jgi:hypothetical protein
MIWRDTTNSLNEKCEDPTLHDLFFDSKWRLCHDLWMPKKDAKSKELSQELNQTLKQLETAIHDWDGIMVDPQPKDTVSQELKQRTQTLLKKLRRQLDGLSD